MFTIKKRYCERKNHKRPGAKKTALPAAPRAGIMTVESRRLPITQIYGNTTGLKAGQIKMLEHVYRRKIPPERLITPELARYLCELSFEIRRQIGVIINRKGAIVAVIAGTKRKS